MYHRGRRPWQPYEDELLRAAAAKEDPSEYPTRWHEIAKHVPDRTNKDCRKRWYVKMASNVLKGGWSREEDERLVQAVQQFGHRWSVVSSIVRTRNRDQCSKRWCDTLDPAIDRTSWGQEADELLLQAVGEYGKLWTKIVKMHFPGRTGLSAKNRYNSLQRAHGSSSSRTTTPSPRSSLPVDCLPEIGMGEGSCEHHMPMSAAPLHSSSLVFPSAPSFFAYDSWQLDPFSSILHPLHSSSTLIPECKFSSSFASLNVQSFLAPYPPFLEPYPS